LNSETQRMGNVHTTSRSSENLNRPLLGAVERREGVKILQSTVWAKKRERERERESHRTEPRAQAAPVT
jgi:hypothetical protein